MYSAKGNRDSGSRIEGSRLKVFFRCLGFGISFLGAVFCVQIFRCRVKYVGMRSGQWSELRVQYSGSELH